MDGRNCKLRLFDRPPAFFIFFNKRNQDIEPSCFVAAHRRIPKPFDFFQGCSMVGIGADWTDVHAHLLRLRHIYTTHAAVRGATLMLTSTS
jgi:hypothetical protein